MNANDVRVLRAMGFAPFMERPPSLAAISPPRVARQLGLTAQTVKTRLRKLERSGVVTGYRLYPHFGLLGLEVASIHIRAGNPTRKRTGLAKLRTLDGVWSVYDFQGGDVCMDLFAPSAGELRSIGRAAAQELAGEAHGIYEFRLPAVDVELAPLDWRIVAGLRHNPRRPLPWLAQDLRVSVKTVRRRLNRMDQAGVLDAVAMFDPSRLDGVFCLLMIHFTRRDFPALRRTVLSLFRERWFAQWSPPDPVNGHLVVQIMARSVREAEELRLQAESLPGVPRAEAIIPTGIHVNEEWVDRAIGARAGSTLVSVVAPPGAG